MMDLLDLVPNWLKETLGKPANIAYIIFCLFIVQTWSFVQYKSIQDAREKIWIDERNLAEKKQEFLESRLSYPRAPLKSFELDLSKTSTSAVIIDTTNKRKISYTIDSLMLEIRKLRNELMGKEKIKGTIDRVFFPGGSETQTNSTIRGLTGEFDFMITLRGISRRDAAVINNEFNLRLHKYYRIIGYVAVLQLPLVILLIKRMLAKRKETKPEDPDVEEMTFD